MYDLHQMYLETYPRSVQLETRHAELRRQLQLAREIEDARAEIRPARRRRLWRRRLLAA